MSIENGRKKIEKKDKKGVDKRIKIVYNKRCRKRLQTAACDEYTEKYSRGRRGAPAKGVGRLPRRESSNLSFSANKKRNFCLPKVPFLFIQAAGLAYHRRTKCGVYHQGRLAALVSHHAPACILPAPWWYPALRADDIPQRVADDIHAFGVIGMRGCENSWISLQYMI